MDHFEIRSSSVSGRVQRKRVQHCFAMTFALSAHPLAVRIQELKKVWALSLGISIAVYAYHFAQFPIGNHDWGRMDGELDFYQVQLGRWFNPAIMALSWFKQVPVLNGVLALVGYVTAALLSCLLLETATSRRMPPAAVYIACLLSSLLPFSNWTFFFAWSAAVGPVAQVLCVAGMLLVAHQPSRRAAAAGAVLFCLSMASYQSTLNTAACLFWIVGIALLYVRDTGPRDRAAWRTLLYLAGSIAVGAGLYKLSLSVLGALGVLANTYHFKFVGFGELPARAKEVLYYAFHHFLAPNPFFPRTLKWLLLAVALGGAFSVARFAYRRGRSHTDGALLALSVALAFLLTIYSTKLQFLISTHDSFYKSRFASFGMSYVYVCFAALGVTLLDGRLRKLLTLGAGVALWMCLVEDLSWQHSQVTQSDYDTRMINRVISRIEGLPGFQYDRGYKLVHCGSLYNVRPARYDYDGPPAPYHNYNLIPPWAPHKAYVGLEPRLKIEESISYKKLSQGRDDPALRRLLDQVDQSEAWPHESSVSLVDDTIVIVLQKPRKLKAKRGAHSAPAH